MVNNDIIAIIPARGGSKRIPKKNIIDIDGKPMIAWTINAALASKYISKVIVSTDDIEIANISKKYKAEVPFLRNENADDHSPVSLATINTIKRLQPADIKPDTIVIQLMANCPLRDNRDIDNAVENFISNNNTFQISCFKYGWMNPWWAYRIDENDEPIAIFDKTYRESRSQDLPTLYCPTGATWIAKAEDLLKANSFYGPGYKFYPMSWQHALDIDDYEDLEMIKALKKSD